MTKNMRLFSYCLRFDSGSAPNPFWGICTLAICKPVIRRVAEKGDWVVGLGSKEYTKKDITTSIVYAMKITDKMSMKEYDEYSIGNNPNKIPKWDTKDYRHKVGDSIYDFSNNVEPAIRLSVHDEMNRERDLGGNNVLLSEHFYYFGDKPVELPEHLQEIILRGQGHKSISNEPHKDDFVKWISENYLKNKLYGKPQIIFSDFSECLGVCSQRDLEEDKIDESCGNNKG